MLLPDPHLAAAMNAEVEARLNVALDHLIVDVLGHRPPPTPRSGGPVAHALQAVMREAALTGDVDAIRNLYDAHRDVLTLSGPRAGARIIAWGDETLRPSERALLQAAFSDDIGLTARLVSPDPESVRQVSAAVDSFRVMLPAVVPMWWREFETIVSTVILASATGDQQGFGGASAFAAWGAILVNSAHGDMPLKLAMTLIHESSHLKLFHAYLDDEIVLNDPEARYASPLRREGRPMNGLFHAAFVLARMVRFASDLLASGQVDAVMGEGAEAQLRADFPRHVAAFEEAHAVIAAHGDLTPKGVAILAEAADGVAASKALQRSP